MTHQSTSTIYCVSCAQWRYSSHEWCHHGGASIRTVCPHTNGTDYWFATVKTSATHEHVRLLLTAVTMRVCTAPTEWAKCHHRRFISVSAAVMELSSARITIQITMRSFLANTHSSQEKRQVASRKAERKEGREKQPAQGPAAAPSIQECVAVLWRSRPEMQYMKRQLGGTH